MAWTPRRKRLAFITVVLVVVAVVTVLVLLMVPIAQEQSGYTLIGLRLYSFEEEHVFGSPWSNFSYRGVTFAFHVWCAITSGGGEVCGNVTESNGGVSSFSFSDGPPGEPRWATWVSPDAGVAIQFESLSGGLVHLLVST